MAYHSTLIAYFSHAGENYVNGNIVDLPIGNTEVVAKKLQSLTGAELLRIEQAELYPQNYNELTGLAKRELRENARPVLKSLHPKMEKYDFLVLGYPNWWGTMPMAVWTFLESIDTRNKKIALSAPMKAAGWAEAKRICANCARKLKLCQDWR